MYLNTCDFIYMYIYRERERENILYTNFISKGSLILDHDQLLGICFPSLSLDLIQNSQILKCKCSQLHEYSTYIVDITFFLIDYAKYKNKHFN